MARLIRHQRPLRRSGFTIVEAVVVISAIGIMAAVAAPRFLAMSEFSTSQAHRQTLADLRFAQRRGASSGCPVQVDFTGTGYTLSQRAACRTGAFGLDLVDPVTNLAPYTIDLASNVVVTSSVDPLVFDSLGRVTTTAGVVTNVAIDVGGRPLEVIGETGFVRVP